MTDLEIMEDIKKIISEDFAVPIEDIEEESYFDEDLGISDLDMEDLLAKLEQKYGIQIPQDQQGSFKKVSDLVSYLWEKSESAS